MWGVHGVPATCPIISRKHKVKSSCSRVQKRKDKGPRRPTSTSIFRTCRSTPLCLFPHTVWPKHQLDAPLNPKMPRETVQQLCDDLDPDPSPSLFVFYQLSSQLNPFPSPAPQRGYNGKAILVFFRGKASWNYRPCCSLKNTVHLLRSSAIKD